MEGDAVSKLFWVDLETTGLKPDFDQIIQVGLVVTDADLKVLDVFEEVVGLSPTFPLSPFVREMHTKSGLLERCYASDRTAADVQQQAVRFIERHSEPGKDVGPMCGSSVHFDRAFLFEDMPFLHAKWSYRNLDVSSIKEACKAFGIADPSKDWPKEHTAARDLSRSIRELRRYQKLLQLGWDEISSRWTDTWATFDDG